MSTPFNSYWLQPGAVVPVDVKTTATLLQRVKDDEALLRQALEALEYAAEMTEPVGATQCDCPICNAVAALRERLVKYKPTENEGSEP